MKVRGASGRFSPIWVVPQDSLIKWLLSLFLQGQELFLLHETQERR